MKEVRTRADLRIGPLGSGSDYTAFIDHLGIASLNLAYTGEDRGGIYHSVYDDFYWYMHFSDTNFVYGRAMAQDRRHHAHAFADADVLPYDFVDCAQHDAQVRRRGEEAVIRPSAGNPRPQRGDRPGPVRRGIPIPGVRPCRRPGKTSRPS